MSTAAETRARALLARATPRTLALPDRGVDIALLDWEGDGPLVLLHHANGFCKGIWALVAEDLSRDFRVVSMDARGHGDSSHPADLAAYRESTLAADVIAVAERLAAQHGAPVALGIGHSLGGAMMLRAAAHRVDLFSRLLLVDPVIGVHEPEHSSEHPSATQRLVAGARKRRTHWPSRAAARAWCRERSFFSAWREEAIELYLLDGMAEAPDGSVTLKCPSAVEAEVFANVGTSDNFALGADVRAPTLILWAARGDFSRPRMEAVALTMAEAHVEPIDSGHLVPMENPELVSEAARRMLAVAQPAAVHRR
ncbi:MAG: alpha/beta fold hydrolase [Candidatus Binatia bacterium]